jgi:hypothetical protein
MGQSEPSRDLEQNFQHSKLNHAIRFETALCIPQAIDKLEKACQRLETPSFEALGYSKQLSTHHDTATSLFACCVEGGLGAPFVSEERLALGTEVDKLEEEWLDVKSASARTPGS